MSVWTRIRLLFNTEVSSALDRAEDPRLVLDYAYNQQRELLITLRRGLVDGGTSKPQLERKKLAMSEMEGLTKQVAEVEADKQRLAAQERSLQVRIEQFRTHRDVV